MKLSTAAGENLEWMQHFVARASFNLGYMYQFGLGIPKDFYLAKWLYTRSIELDPHKASVPITLMLYFLQLSEMAENLPSVEETMSFAMLDIRMHVLALLHVFLLSLVALRRHLAGVERKRKMEAGDLF